MCSMIVVRGQGGGERCQRGRGRKGWARQSLQEGESLCGDFVWVATGFSLFLCCADSCAVCARRVVGLEATDCRWTQGGKIR